MLGGLPTLSPSIGSPAWFDDPPVPCGKGWPGEARGPGVSEGLDRALGVAVDSDGTVYVADAGNSGIRKISGGVVSTLAGTVGNVGTADGTGGAASFATPWGITIANGIIYVTDAGAQTVRAITKAGEVTTIAAGVGLNTPMTIAPDAGGALLVADSQNSTIRIGYPGSPTVPAITTQPQSRTVALHQSVQFTCAASGTPAPSYRWEDASTGVPISTVQFTGTNSATLTVTDADATLNNGRYRCVATNAGGSGTSSAATRR